MRWFKVFRGSPYFAVKQVPVGPYLLKNSLGGSIFTMTYPRGILSMQRRDPFGRTGDPRTQSLEGCVALAVKIQPYRLSVPVLHA